MSDTSFCLGAVCQLFVRKAAFEQYPITLIVESATMASLILKLYLAYRYLFKFIWPHTYLMIVTK